MEDKNKGGRPTKYEPEYAKRAFDYALLGATDKQLAVFFEVSESTINLWKLEHNEFSESLKKGKERADANVVKSLYKRAIGFKVPDTKVFQYEGESVIVPIEKYYPPEVTAQIFWLKNRRPEQWRDKKQIEAEIKNIEINGETAKIFAEALERELNEEEK